MRSAGYRLIAIVLSALAACDDAATVDDACQNVCDCEQPLPAANRQCVAACVSALEAQPVNAPCLECLSGRSCQQLGAGDPCFSCQDLDGTFELAGRTALSP